MVDSYSIFEFDNKWNYVNVFNKFHDMMYYWNYYQYQNSLLALKINNNDDVIFYLTNTYGIYKYSRNWTQLGVYLNYDNYNNYGKLIYSSKTDHLLVTSGSEIDVFDRYLTFIKSII